MKTFKWVVEFEVDESWVMDGFNLTDARAMDMLAHDLDYAYAHELGASVIKAPPPLRIAKAQGVTLDAVMHEIADGKLEVQS